MPTSRPKYHKHVTRVDGVERVYARTCLFGKTISLGRYGTQESRDKYEQVIRQFEERQAAEGSDTLLTEPPAKSEGEARYTIADLVADYLDHAAEFYGTGARTHYSNMKPTLRRLVDMFGNEAADEFGSKKLMRLRELWIDQGQSRSYINDQTNVIRKVFKWSVAEETVSPAVYQKLMAVANLQRGRTQARETEPVKPVDDSVVDATIEASHEILACMIRIQRLTGMRPSEVCQLRPCDIDRTGDVWRFRPGRHKTERLGKERIVAIGPRAQAVLMPFMLRAPSDHCFRPCEVSDQGKLAYSVGGYRQAIHRACKRAGVEKWSPNQLRHTAATQIRREFDIESARVTLGHSNARITADVYAEKDMSLAEDVARQVG